MSNPRLPLAPPLAPVPSTGGNAAVINRIADAACEELGLDTSLARVCMRQALVNLIVMNDKQHDYGPHNLTKFGVPGVVVRASDKMERLIVLTRPGANGPRVGDEKIGDTCKDLANYGLIMQVMAADRWPNHT